MTLPAREYAGKAVQSFTAMVFFVNLLETYTWVVTGRSALVFADGSAIDLYHWALSSGSFVGRVFAAGSIALAIVFGIEMCVLISKAIATAWMDTTDGSPQIASGETEVGDRR